MPQPPIHPNTVPRAASKPSYDDITRKTVPLPDSSYRPSTDEVEQAEHPALREPSELEALIAAGIRSAIADEASLDGADIGVTVTGTTATLEGSVATSADRRSAVEIAWSVPGVTAVVDELKVRLD